jgi:hypothetical protein
MASAGARRANDKVWVTAVRAIGVMDFNGNPVAKRALSTAGKNGELQGIGIARTAMSGLPMP